MLYQRSGSKSQKELVRGYKSEQEGIIVGRKI